MHTPYRDPVTGRMARDPSRPANPFAAWVPPVRQRDGRSDKRRADRPIVNVRLPPIAFQKLHALAEKRDVTVTQIVLEALFPILEPELQPVLQAQNDLVDEVGSGKPVLGSDGHVYFGLSSKRDRLANRIKSEVTDPIPAFDAVSRGNRREEERKGAFVATLIDKPRR